MMFAIDAPMSVTAPYGHMRSASDIGWEIRQSLTGVFDHFRSSLTFGDPWRQTISNLAGLMAECSQNGWDGYDAPSIADETVSNAVEFIRTIPLSVSLPEISATSAGDITFEWARTAHRIVTVAVGETGEIHYASLIGLKKNFGSYPLNGNFEPELQNLIESVLG